MNTTNQTTPATYWNNNGKFQAEYHELFKKLIPGNGPASTRPGELLRAISKLYYRWFNDGDRIQPFLEPSIEHGASVIRAWNYLRRYHDPAFGFSGEKLAFEILEARGVTRKESEAAYEAALERMADAVTEYAAKTEKAGNQPRNTEDYLSEEYASDGDFEFADDDEDETW